MVLLSRSLGEREAEQEVTTRLTDVFQRIL
jgi:hypothetical protein